MPEIRDATVVIGVPGLNGTGVTGAEKTDIYNRITALEAEVIPADISDLSDVDTTGAANGDLLQYDGTDWVPYTPEAIDVTVGAAIIIDGGGSAITTGIKGDLEIPFAGTITAARNLNDQSGSIEIAVWKDTYANFPPVAGDLVFTYTSTAATKGQQTGLSYPVSAGDILRFNVNSASTVTRVTFALTLAREVGP